jgi:hypothetical protein
VASHRNCCRIGLGVSNVIHEKYLFQKKKHRSFDLFRQRFIFVSFGRALRAAVKNACVQAISIRSVGWKSQKIMPCAENSASTG